MSACLPVSASLSLSASNLSLCLCLSLSLFLSVCLLFFVFRRCSRVSILVPVTTENRQVAIDFSRDDQKSLEGLHSKLTNPNRHWLDVLDPDGLCYMVAETALLSVGDRCRVLWKASSSRTGPSGQSGGWLGFNNG